MGYRTVVILYNDQAHEWENDPKLGEKISRAMHEVAQRSEPSSLSYSTGASIHYGNVVECAHADGETLAMIESYSFYPLAYGSWHSGKSIIKQKLELLTRAAETMGYHLVKNKPEPEIVGTNHDGHDI